MAKINNGLWFEDSPVEQELTFLKIFDFNFEMHFKVEVKFHKLGTLKRSWEY